jgi:hypothetical protein
VTTIRWTHRRVLIALVVALAAAHARAQAPSAFAGMIPAPGDAHRHTGVAESLMQRATCGGHTFGLPQRIYQDAAAAGYRWLNASHHDFQVSASEQSPVYQWWISRTDADDILDLQGRKVVDFPQAGFPNWSDPLQRPVAPPHRESLSLFSATSAAPAGFAAFSGLEYTPYAAQGPTSSGHLLALFPGAVESACALPPGLSAGSGAYADAAEQCPRALDFYLWLKRHAGVGIAAHPRWPVELLDARTRPNGLSDLFLEGLSLGLRTIYGDQVLREWAWRGLRMFPSVDSDYHTQGCDQFVAGASAGNVPRAADGGTVCWVVEDPARPGQVTRQAVLEAMRARRCYAAAPGFPTLTFEVCPDYDIVAGCRATPRAMGARVEAAKFALVRAVAQNDPRNDRNTYGFDRIELVGVSRSNPDARGEVLGSLPCSRGTQTCTFSTLLRPPVDASSTPVPYALYARVCSLPAGAEDCDQAAALRAGTLRAVSAPLYFHWRNGHGCRGDEPDRDADFWPDCPDNCPARANSDQRESGPTSDGLGDACDPDDDNDGLCDPDADPAACLANLRPGMAAALCTGCTGRDSCPRTPDADPRDADADGVFDSCDLCPTHPDPAQTDRDADGVGDACDNCIEVANPRGGAWALPAQRTTVGGQLDDDADGLGNACDLDLDADAVVERCEVASVEFAALTGRTVADLCDDQCRPGAQLPCKLLDVNGRDLQIPGPAQAGSQSDIDWARWLLFNPGLRASCCAPPFAPGECRGPACDSDDDGVLDDGDASGSAGDYLCAAPQRLGCDDNCPFVANPDQQADATRIGSACRCGDVSGDGRLSVADFNTCPMDASRPRCADFCDANGDRICDVRDLVALRMAIFGQWVPICDLYPQPLPGVVLPGTGG